MLVIRMLKMQLRHFKWPLISVVFMSHSIAFSETIEGALGYENTSVASSIYITSAMSSVEGVVTYSRPIFGRWSMQAQYQTNMNSTLSAGLGGVVFDSADLLSKGGNIRNDGTSEISRVPLWLYRGSLGLGLYKYVDTLQSNDLRLGKNNRVPVQADLIGLKFSVSVVRFLFDDFGISFSGAYSVASATNFGLSSTCLSLGALYRN